MFLRWSLSYLIISVIALLLILFSGFRYTAVLRENLEYTNGIQLDMTCVWLDQKLGLLRNITAKESLDSSITKIRNATDYDTTPKFSYYLLTKEVATDLISFGIEDPYFLYFPATDAMVSNAYYGQSQRYYELRLEPFGISYEEWMGILAQDYATTQVFKPEQSDDTNYLVLVRPLNINSTKGNKVNAVMLVDGQLIVLLFPVPAHLQIPGSGPLDHRGVCPDQSRMGPRIPFRGRPRILGTGSLL